MLKNAYLDAKIGVDPAENELVLGWGRRAELSLRFHFLSSAQSLEIAAPGRSVHGECENFAVIVLLRVDASDSESGLFF